MKSQTLALVVVLFCRVVWAEAPKTAEGFVAAVRAAYESKDAKRVEALEWTKGASSGDLAMAEGALQMILPMATVESVELSPKIAEAGPMVANGKRIEPTYKPVGSVVLKMKPEQPGDSGAISMPYAVIDGGYYIVTSKTTDLGWRGPADKSLTVSVIGRGQDKVRMKVKYNASGVDLEMDQVVGSAGLLGQYVDEVAVTSTSDDVDVKLKIAEGMKPMYESQPLKGKGTLTYKRGDKSE